MFVFVSSFSRSTSTFDACASRSLGKLCKKISITTNVVSRWREYVITSNLAGYVVEDMEEDEEAENLCRHRCCCCCCCCYPLLIIVNCACCKKKEKKKSSLDKYNRGRVSEERKDDSVDSARDRKKEVEGPRRKSTLTIPSIEKRQKICMRFIEFLLNPPSPKSSSSSSSSRDGRIGVARSIKQKKILTNCSPVKNFPTYTR